MRFIFKTVSLAAGEMVLIFSDFPEHYSPRIIRKESESRQLFTIYSFINSVFALLWPPQDSGSIKLFLLDKGALEVLAPFLKLFLPWFSPR